MPVNRLPQGLDHFYPPLGTGHHFELDINSLDTAQIYIHAD